MNYLLVFWRAFANQNIIANINLETEFKVSMSSDFVWLLEKARHLNETLNIQIECFKIYEVEGKKLKKGKLIYPNIDNTLF